jgi:polyisoprenoid-binding protein YceI
MSLFAWMSCNNNNSEKAEITDSTKIVNGSAGETFNVNTNASKIIWEGYKPTGTHKGTIDLAAGALKIENGKVVDGKFTMDMNSIAVVDLSGKQKDNLEAHLKGTSEGKEDDFFNVHDFPTATFEISKTIELKNDEATNLMVYGNLTIKDQVQQIGIKSKLTIENNIIKLFAPKFSIDRTKWGLKYKSKNFGDFKDNFINDDIGISISVIATK